MLALFRKSSAFASIVAQFRTLKFSLLLATGCVAAILTADLSFDGIDAWSKFQYAKSVRSADFAGNHLVNASYSLLREQPAINGAFRAPGIVGDGSFQRIDSFKKTADEEFSSALTHLTKIGLPNKLALLDAIEAARQSANVARIKVRGMIAVPKAQREPAALTAFNTAMTSLMKATLNLWTATGYLETQSDPLLIRYSRIKSISWKLREIAGVERAVVTEALIVNQPIGTIGNQTIDLGRAQILMGMQLLSELSDMDAKDSPIRLAMSEANRNYYRLFQPLVDEARNVTANGPISQLNFNEWIARTNAHIDSFLDVLKTTAKAGEAHAARLESNAFIDFIFRTCGILIALGATAACFLLIVKRVTDPLARINATVNQLAAGRLDVHVADTGRADEIGDVARAVDFFKTHLIQTKDMAAIRDAERAAKEKRAAALEALAKAFEHKVAGVAESFESSSTELEATSRSLSVSAEQTNQQSQSVATTARQTSMNVQAVVTATGELARAAQEIGERVANSSRIAGNAVEYSRHAEKTESEERSHSRRKACQRRTIPGLMSVGAMIWSKVSSGYFSSSSCARRCSAIAERVRLDCSSRLRVRVVRSLRSREASSFTKAGGSLNPSPQGVTFSSQL